MQKLLLSLLWENDAFKAFFTTRPTKNPDEYLWFSLDKDTEEREHWTYTVEDNGTILIEFDSVIYKVKELKGMRRYDITMIQWVEVEDSSCYMNWEGKEIPEIKGNTYVIKY